MNCELELLHPACEGGRSMTRVFQAALAVLLLTLTIGAGRAWATPVAGQDLAGQRVIYSYPGLVPPDTLLQRIRAGQVAGVIFFGENISSLSQIHSVVQQLRDANAQ